MKLAGKRMQLQTIIYSEIIQIKKDKQKYFLPSVHASF